MFAVEADGTEQPVDLRHMPAAYHGVTHFLNDFEGLPHEDRWGVCVGLVEAARLQYPDVAGVAIDHVLGRIPVDPGRPPTPPSRRIRVQQCRAE